MHMMSRAKNSTTSRKTNYTPCRKTIYKSQQYDLRYKNINGDQSLMHEHRGCLLSRQEQDSAAQPTTARASTMLIWHAEKAGWKVLHIHYTTGISLCKCRWLPPRPSLDSDVCRLCTMEVSSYRSSVVTTPAFVFEHATFSYPTSSLSKISPCSPGSRWMAFGVRRAKVLG